MKNEFKEKSNIINNTSINPDVVLKKQIGKLKDVGVVGIDKDGDFFMASSCPPDSFLPLLKLAQDFLNNNDDLTRGGEN